jgi:hypothetical protein
MKGVNRIAIVVTVILHQMLAFVWYGVLFYDPWLAGLGKEPADVDQGNPLPYILDIGGWTLASCVIAWLVRMTNVRTAGQGAVLGIALWLGLAVPTLVPHYAFARISPVVTLIDAGNVLVACMMTGGILAVWRTQ